MNINSINDILEILRRMESKLDRLLADKALAASPYLNGDKEAARYAGFKSRDAFRLWAKKRRLRPDQTTGVNIWDKAAIKRARDPEAQPIL